jgi:hypothetical protein
MGGCLRWLAAVQAGRRGAGRGGLGRCRRHRAGVAAPRAGDFMKGRMKGMNLRWTMPESPAPKDLRTTPGCSALAVTQVPWSLRASS